MKMTDMAMRTAQLWLDLAESEASNPNPALLPDPYNEAFYNFTRKDPDNEVSLTSHIQWDRPA